MRFLVAVLVGATAHERDEALEHKKAVSAPNVIAVMADRACNLELGRRQLLASTISILASARIQMVLACVRPFVRVYLVRCVFTEKVFNENMPRMPCACASPNGIGERERAGMCVFVHTCLSRTELDGARLMRFVLK